MALQFSCTSSLVRGRDEHSPPTPLPSWTPHTFAVNTCACMYSSFVGKWGEKARRLGCHCMKPTRCKGRRSGGPPLSGTPQCGEEVMRCLSCKDPGLCSHPGFACMVLPRCVHFYITFLETRRGCRWLSQRAAGGGVSSYRKTGCQQQGPRGWMGHTGCVAGDC